MFAEISLLNKLFKINDFAQIKARILKVYEHVNLDGPNNGFIENKEYAKIIEKNCLVYIYDKWTNN
jgi:hypothetical protein